MKNSEFGIWNDESTDIHINKEDKAKIITNAEYRDCIYGDKFLGEHILHRIVALDVWELSR